MITVLNVKVGSRLTFKDASGLERDAEVVEFPKIIRVKTDDGLVQDIRHDQVIAEEPGKPAGRFQGRLQPRL